MQPNPKLTDVALLVLYILRHSDKRWSVDDLHRTIWKDRSKIRAALKRLDNLSLVREAGYDENGYRMHWTFHNPVAERADRILAPEHERMCRASVWYHNVTSKIDR